MSAAMSKLVEAFTLWYDATHWYPFIEDEDCNVTGPGHQDPKVFAAAVADYDRYCGGPDELDDLTGSVKHRWVSPSMGDDERLVVVEEGTPGAWPVTTIWGVR